eukprot:gb/GFBE01066201.1/.p1 GENE.gb/GFBE01066201.1/~~gb/GFBE01066201.1/.p1  ORF type:complete len:122 (+),score=14.79 gb/GFBE01066201.1/:1-366(+)
MLEQLVCCWLPSVVGAPVAAGSCGLSHWRQEFGLCSVCLGWHCVRGEDFDFFVIADSQAVLVCRRAVKRTMLRWRCLLSSPRAVFVFRPDVMETLLRLRCQLSAPIAVFVCRLAVERTPED